MNKRKNRHDPKKVPGPLHAAVWAAAVIAVLLVCALGAWSALTGPVTRDPGKERSVRIEVPHGMSVRQVGAMLSEQNLIRSQKLFYYAARLSLYDRKRPFKLKSGVYTVRSSMGLKEIYMLLQSGEQEYITLSLPEGLTIGKIARALENLGICGADEFREACGDSELLREYSVPAASFEGYLFPDTYFLIPGMGGTKVVRALADNFFRRLGSIPGAERLSPEELHERIILASVVEREYRAEDEAPVIASVFVNRLKHNIGLYSCATIEYIITEIQGRPHPERITYDDLRIDSPYNTYKWAGLPPGPISNPGMIALRAALYPAETDFYFFVLTDPASGRHTFSRNFDQHKAAENLNYVTKKAP